MVFLSTAMVSGRTMDGPKIIRGAAVRGQVTSARGQDVAKRSRVARQHARCAAQRSGEAPEQESEVGA
jgi:hypothetical protein